EIAGPPRRRRVAGRARRAVEVRVLERRAGDRAGREGREVPARGRGARGDDDRVRARRRGLGPAGRQDLADRVGAGRQAGEAVVARRVGRRLRLAGVLGAVGVGVDVDDAAGERRLAGLAGGAVGVGVLVDRAADGRRAPYAEVLAGVGLARADRAGVQTARRRRARPAGLADDADPVAAVGQAGEVVLAERVGGRRRLARVLGRVVVVVGVDEPARQPGLAGLG